MKKQILTLIMVVIAIGFSTAFGQNASDPPTCNATALSPAVGELYNYAATISPNPPYDGTGNFTWYVTQNANLLDASAIIPNNEGEIIASGGGSYNTLNPGPDGNNINIVWTSVALATGLPYYLVVRYEQVNVSATPNCTAMNMKVYRIIPQNTFWLKIESVADAVGTAGGVEQCAANVSAANIVAGNVEYIYGQNILFAKITASGYVGDWTPTLQITGGVDDQAVGAAGITWTSGALSGTFTGGGAFGNGTYTSNISMPSSMIGSVIIVTIPIDNNHHEGLTNQTLAVAIDGSYVGGATTFNDKSDVNGNCTDALAFEDTVDKIIKARPTVSPVAPSTFVPEPATKP